MKIEQIRLKNFKALKDVHISDVPRMAVFLGANGSGKSTLFDVFSFLQDCLVHNVRAAVMNRGGFKELRSREATGDVEIELKFRIQSGDPLVTYELHVGEAGGSPVVARERLQYRRGSRGRPWRFLDFSNGSGTAITNESEYEPGATYERVDQKLQSPDILALKGLGQFERFKAAAAFRTLIESWHVSDLHVTDARASQEAGYAEHLTTGGENLALVAQYMFQNHRDTFGKMLAKMKARVPGVVQVEAKETEDGRIVLRFADGAFKDPFIARFVSDGTLRMFAYLILLHDPNPHPLLAVEEPENQLYPNLLQPLAEEFREYADRGGQVFISTHSPDFVNGLRIEELFWLEKVDGFTRVLRAKEDQNICALMKEGDLLGALWKQRIFGNVDPQ
ncbi:MAG: ATPase [Chthonomonas sp.]